jgi:hypothetical protein
MTIIDLELGFFRKARYLLASAIPDCLLWTLKSAVHKNTEDEFSKPWPDGVLGVFLPIKTAMLAITAIAPIGARVRPTMP